jgi:hypothetical protein
MLNTKMLVIKLDFLSLEFYNKNLNDRTNIHINTGIRIRYVGWCIVEVNTAAILHNLSMLNSKMIVTKLDLDSQAATKQNRMASRIVLE